jgi:hypothetical protein
MSRTHRQIDSCAGCFIIITMFVGWAVFITVGLRIIRWALG